MEKERIREEAATWVVRLADSCTEEEQAEFETWRARSVDHEVAYLMAEQNWCRLDRVKALFTPQIASEPDTLFDVPGPPSTRPVSQPKRRWVAIAASVILCCVIATPALEVLTATQAYATAIGGHQKVVLADGSTVELNTDTRIEVRFAHGLRSVRLLKGEAAFHVANDPRPFIVHTKAVRLNTQMADMAVRLIGSEARITIQSGAAFASDSQAPGHNDAVSTLGPHSEAIAGPDGVHIQAVAAAEMDRLLAWRRGGIALSGQTLGEAVDEFNRYNLKKISVSDDATRSIRVGGYFLTTDVDRFVSAVTDTFPVDAREDGDGNFLLSHS